MLLIAENESGLYELFAVNDTTERVSAQYSVSDGDTEEILLKGSVSVNENGIKKVGPDRRIIFVSASFNDKMGGRFFGL